MSFDNSKVQTLINKIKSQILGDIEDEIEEHNVVANSSRTGHVQAGSSPQDINTSETSSAGTDNGYYARADHVHKIATASTTGKGIVQLDSTPTANSSNGVTSHGIKTALNEVMNGTNVGTFTELQTLITNASSGDTIILDKDYKNNGGENRITIDKPLTIIGNGHVIDADEESGIFNITNSTGNCNISSLIFVNGKTSSGGAIYCTSSNISIFDCSFMNNTATNSGGAISCSSSNTISNCSFIKNTANAGGAIDCYLSNTISNCSFINNTANNGGAIVCGSSNNSISDCSFVNNTAVRNGANINANDFGSATLIIYNCHITTGLYNTVNYDDINSKNLVSSWSSTVTNTHVASEKLVKDSLDDKLESSDLLNLIYPIGSIYLDAGNHNVCPIQTLLGGTWSRIEDRFLLASGSTYSATYDNNGFANKTAGSADAVVVEHNHTQGTHTHTQASHTHTQASHTHTTGNSTYKYFYAGKVAIGTSSSKKAHTNNTNGVYLVYSNDEGGDTIKEYTSIQSVTPTINGTTPPNLSDEQPTINNSGETGTGKNMPPYLVVNVWKRTA